MLFSKIFENHIYVVVNVFDEKLEKELKTDNEINLLEVPGKAAGPPPKPASGFVPAPYFPGVQEEQAVAAACGA